MRTHAIPEHLRDVLTTRRYTNPRLPLPYLTILRSLEGKPLYFAVLSFFTSKDLTFEITEQPLPSVYQMLDSGLNLKNSLTHPSRKFYTGSKIIKCLHSFQLTSPFSSVVILNCNKFSEYKTNLISTDFLAVKESRTSKSLSLTV